MRTNEEGRHPPILDEATWAAGRRAADARLKKTDQSSHAHRIYLLTGKLECDCGRRFHGQTRSSRGHEWMYYLCRGCCDRSAIPTKEADAAVLAELGRIILPPATIEAAAKSCDTGFAFCHREPPMSFACGSSFGSSA